MSDTAVAPRVILASASPRRRELLSLIGIAHEVRPADIDESAFPDEAPRRVADTLAEFGDVRGRLIHGAHDGEFHGRTYLM